jgi:hypothetical protein
MAGGSAGALPAAQPFEGARDSDRITPLERFESSRRSAERALGVAPSGLDHVEISFDLREASPKLFDQADETIALDPGDFGHLLELEVPRV